MCLITKETFPRKAWEDISVFKILKKTKNDILYSPWYNFQFNLDKIYEDKQIENRLYTYKNLSFIGLGYFHSYSTIEAAKDKLEEIQKYEPKTDFRIYKATIPMGYNFYTGEQDDYCSKAIKILEEYV